MSQKELEKLATYLKEFRERAGLSVEDVAAEVGCTAWYIYRIEGSRYHRRPARERLQRICALVGADYDEARRVGGYPEKSDEVQAIAKGLLAPGSSQEPASTAERDDTDPPSTADWDQIEERTRWLRDHDAPAGVQWLILDQLQAICGLTKYLDGKAEYDWQETERADVVKQITADVTYMASQRPPMPMLWLLSEAVSSHAGLVSWREKMQTQELAA